MTEWSLTRLLDLRARLGTGSALRQGVMAASRRVVDLEHVVIHRLSEPPPAPPDAGTTRWATAADFALFAADAIWDHELSVAEAEALTARGHRCVVNEVDGELAGYAWMCRDRAIIPQVRASYPLESHEIFIYKGFTHPRHRRRRLGWLRYAHWFETSDVPRLQLISHVKMTAHLAHARASQLPFEVAGSVTYMERGSFVWRHARGLLRGRVATPLPLDLPHRDH